MRWPAARRVTIAITALTMAMLNPGSLAAAQPPLPDSPSRMRLEIDTLTPRVITADTPAITITGRVTNTGDRRIDEVRVQLRRGEPLATEAELRDARNQLTDSAVSPFVQVSAALEQGQSAPIQVTVPVRGDDTSLRIDEPGVYPLLVNINGRPEFGGRARLAAVSVLLPALSIPGGDAVPKPADPTRLTVLWPLIDDRPRQLPNSDGRLLLTDDDLATSLAPGGRLYGLVNTAQQAAATHPGLLDALCFAIDPDLVETVSGMASGYRVRQPDGQAVDGQGGAAARTWLQRLRALTTDQCVIAVPYADADLVALSRAGAVDLEKLALSSGSIVSDVLAPARPLPGVVWPVGGTVDQRTLLDLPGNGATTVLVDPAHLRHLEGQQPYLVGDSPDAGTRAVPIDMLVSSFLDENHATDNNSAAQPATPEEARPVSVQNGLAALTFRAAFSGVRNGSLVITPPRRWAAPAAELSVLLDAVGQVFQARLAQPQRLQQVVADEPRGTASGLDYTADDTGAEILPSVTAEVVRINTAQRDIYRAMQVDDTTKVDPQALVRPIEYGLLRATSTAWRGQGGQADQAVGAVAGQLDALRGQVTVVNSGRPLTLASGDSPIPVQLSNTLPVTVVVRINLSETPGLRPGVIPDLVIPAHGSRNSPLPVEVTRAGRFTVDVSLSTPGGTPLGAVARLELTSTAYGSITLIVTGTAAGALFLLAGIRIFRRVRLAKAGGGPRDVAPNGPAGSAEPGGPTEERAD